MTHDLQTDTDHGARGKKRRARMHAVDELAILCMVPCCFLSVSVVEGRFRFTWAYSKSNEPCRPLALRVLTYLIYVVFNFPVLRPMTQHTFFR